MQEIVTIDGVTRLFLALAVFSPVLGLLIAGVMTVRRVERGEARRWGLLVGLCGPGNWLLWKLYNALTEHNGLDTVRNFEINLVVFVLIGLALGLVLNRLQPSAKPEVASEEPPSPSDVESNGEQGAQ